MSLNNILLFVIYIVCTTAGLLLLKLGGQGHFPTLLTLPLLNLKVSLVSLFGLFFYGLSFVLYSKLLTIFELMYLYPATIGITAVLIYIGAVVIFGETVTLAKIGSLVLILSGVLTLNLLK
jgi:multidrug transporter EmrE-like cation transporter